MCPRIFRYAILSFLLKVSDAEFSNYAAMSKDDKDFERKEMAHHNPYPKFCPEDLIKSNDNLRLCILEQKWINEHLINGRRSAVYNFMAEVNKIIPMRMKTDPANKQDCLNSTRYRVREVPFFCYNPEFQHIPDIAKYWDAFFSEIINELRFVFDHVLYDPTINTRIEDKFWYLILYLKKLVVEVPNPYVIAKTRKTYHRDKNYYDKRFKQLEQQISLFHKDVRDLIKKVVTEYKIFTTFFRNFVAEASGKSGWGW